MFRKFILVAGLALFERGSTTQLMLAQLCCFWYVVFVVNKSPYKKDDADFSNQARVACVCPESHASFRRQLPSACSW